MHRPDDQGFLYTICQALTAAALEVSSQVSFHGLSQLPRNGPFILASNHQSHLDVPLLGAIVKSRIFYVARHTLLKHPVMEWLLPRLRAIPIDRDSKGEVRAMRTIIHTAQAGNAVLIFPEGTRSPDGSIRPVKNGLGMIACRAAVPVIPVRIFGTREVLGKHSNRLESGNPIHCCILPPVFPQDFDPGPGDSDRYAAATAHIMDLIQSVKLPRPLLV